jgi:hypothetical protein
MRGKIIKKGNRALFPLCEPLFGCEILDKGEMRLRKQTWASTPSEPMTVSVEKAKARMFPARAGMIPARAGILETAW